MVLHFLPSLMCVKAVPLPQKGVTGAKVIHSALLLKTMEDVKLIHEMHNSPSWPSPCCWGLKKLISLYPCYFKLLSSAQTFYISKFFVSRELLGTM